MSDSPLLLFSPSLPLPSSLSLPPSIRNLCFLQQTRTHKSSASNYGTAAESRCYSLNWQSSTHPPHPHPQPQLPPSPHSLQNPPPNLLFAIFNNRSRSLWLLVWTPTLCVHEAAWCESVGVCVCVFNTTHRELMTAELRTHLTVFV